MPVRIIRRPKAAADAESIADWIAKDNLDVSLQFLDYVETTLAALAQFPSSGAPFQTDAAELANLRFAMVNGFPNHVVFYIEHKAAIEVIRILHGARDIEVELRDG